MPELNIPWQELIDAAPDGVLLVDGSDRIRYANDATLKLLGLPEPDGEPITDWLAGLGEEHQQLLLRAIEASGQVTLFLPDTEHRYLLFEAEPLDAADGKVCRVRRDYEAAASEDIAIVVHDLRLPMTSIMGYTKMLTTVDTESLTDTQRLFLNTIHRNVKRLNRDLSAVQDMARIDRDKIRLTPTSQNSAEIAKMVLGELHPLVQQKTHGVTLEFPDDLPPVEADAEHFRQILHILLENALKYTPPNGQIKLVGRAVDHMVQIDVADNGLGIPIDEQSRIFSKFFRGEAEQIREYPGLGLSLYIAQGLAKLQRGQLWFRSTPGQGSTFSLTLPAYEARREKE